MLLEGQRYRVKANTPQLLDDPQTVLVIQSGSMALFAVTVKNGVPLGRRYLFSAETGTALFGTPATSSNQLITLFAVPVEQTELLRVAPNSISPLVEVADARIVALFEDWIGQLGAGLSGIPKPAIDVRAEEQGQFSLTHGQTFQPPPGTVSWVQVHQGKVRLLGLQELTLNPDQGIFPLSDGMWLEADGAVQLVTQKTTVIRDLETLLGGISQFQAQLLRCFDLLEQQERTEELQQFWERECLNRQATQQAIGELASTLCTQETDFLPEEKPLLVAAGAVGRVLGVTIRPPAKSIDLKRVKNPIELIARASRIPLRQVLLRDNWWKKDCGPLLAYAQPDNRPVALLPIKAKRYELFDAVARTRTPVDADRAATLVPVAYRFYRPLADKAISSLELLRFALKGLTRDLVVVLLTGIATALLGMLTPQAIGILIDTAIPNSDRSLVLQTGLGLLAAAFGSVIFQLAQGFALLRLEAGSDAATQTALWDRLLNLRFSFFYQYSAGDLKSRVLSISEIRRLLSGTTLRTIFTSLFSLLNLALLFYYSAKLAMLAVGVALITIVVTTVSGVLLVRKVLPLEELDGKIFGTMVQLINGISKLRVAGAEERAFAYWSKKYSQQIKLDLSTQHIEDLVVLFNTVMPTLTCIILFWFAVSSSLESQASGSSGLSTGTFIAFNAAFGTFIGGAKSLSTTVVTALKVIPLHKRAQPILNTQPEVDFSKADPGQLKGRISMEHVTFRYREDCPLTLDDVNIRAEPGEFIALVGPSGSGKSTLLRLLLGFYTSESGRIYYDGQDLSRLDVDAVRRQFGVVIQNSRLTSGSVFENIAGSGRITIDEAWEAARMAGLADDIAAMPMGMHTVVSEGGTNLSGGQRQRLLIARALVLKPRILLFDEATSALDNRTQAIVSESLDKLQVTRVVIAHRLSTIRNAHRIYVLQAGKVVQQGSFEELAGSEGLFAQLMQRQMV